jgi:alkylation response protein AidB-like acyl-CoA dehydrogenase
MTDSLARTLRRYGDPALVERVLPLLTALDLDALQQGAMFMTEQGAGSDVAGTATLASERDDGSWALTGDKWFCSNPDAGFAMVLARSEPTATSPGLKGVSLFLLPRRMPDGTPNAYRILRLKDKLGTRSMASGEIRLEGAMAWLVGERGRGFQQMADMVNNSRLSNGVRAAEAYECLSAVARDYLVGWARGTRDRAKRPAQYSFLDHRPGAVDLPTES